MSGRARRTLWTLMAALAVAVVLVSGTPRPAQAQDLVADLSSHLIAISTAFTGTEVVLFGATGGTGGPIAVVVRGPSSAVTVRRKDQVAGVWMNRDSMTLADVPTFYAVGASAPLDRLAPAPVLQRHGIGVEHLRLEPVPEQAGATPEERDAFRAALIRLKQRQGLYAAEIDTVAFLGDQLFRTTLSFPANVPTGQYSVSTYLFRDGAVVEAQTTPLIISKIGVGAEIFAFARDHAALYGLGAIVLAVTAGWLAGLAFRRG